MDFFLYRQPVKEFETGPVYYGKYKNYSAAEEMRDSIVSNDSKLEIGDFYIIDEAFYV